MASVLPPIANFSVIVGAFLRVQAALEVREESSGRIEIASWGRGGADGGVGQVVLELVVQYRRSARFDELVQVHTRVSSFRGASFQMDYLLTVDDEVCALAATVHGVVDPTGRATRAPQWMKDLLTATSPG